MSLTLAEYSEAKKLSHEFLASLGVKEEATAKGPRLVIPYRDCNGVEVARRFRHALKDGFLWRKGDKPCLYGLDRMDEARKAGFVVLVEGESDCHTMWLHGKPALGVPGANNWREERDAPLLDGVPLIYAIVEPDQGGKALKRALTRSALRNRVRLILMSEGPKDVSGLYLASADREAFEASLQALLEHAEPIATPKAKQSDNEDAEPYFEMRADGLYRREGDKQRRIAQAFQALGLTREAPDARGETNRWGILIRFRNRDGRQRDAVVSYAELHADLGLLCGELADRGMQIERDDRARKAFAQYLIDAVPEERVTLAQSFGWRRAGDHDVYVTSTETIGADALSERVVLATHVNGVHATRGSLAEWRDGAAILAGDHLLARLAVSAALAGPLLYLVRQESGGVHIYGRSSTGKTTLARLAASVWGSGAEQGGWLRTWRATANALEAVFASSCDTTLVFDEIAQADGAELYEVIYLISGGQGKARLKRDVSLRDPFKWRALFFSTGEFPVETKIEEGSARRSGRKTRAGQTVRVLDVPAVRVEGSAFDGGDNFDPLGFIEVVKRETATHYGTAGPAFVKALIARGMDAAASEAQAHVREFAKTSGAESGQAMRAAERFGLIAAAGELAIGFGIIPWPKGAASEAAEWAFAQWLKRRGGTGPYEEGQAIMRARGFIERYGDSRFDRMIATDQRPANDRAGWREGEGEAMRWYVSPEVWRNEICAGLDSNFVARTLAERSALECSDAGRDTKVIWVSALGKSVRVYALTPHLFDT
jgi:uncharacterized protein (DUF927 family)